jgi:cbb3-type cytochrome oxidase subunit 3
VPQGKPNDTPGRTAGAIIFTFVGLGILYYIYREYQKKNSDGQNKLPYADDGKIYWGER